MAETKNEQQPQSFKRKLGNTAYIVKVHFSKELIKPLRIECKVSVKYYWIAKIRKLALEELPRKNHGCRLVMEQAVPAPDTAKEFTEYPSAADKNSSSVPTVVLHIGSVAVELFEDTSCSLLEARTSQSFR